MATNTESIPDIIPSDTPDPQRLSTAPTEESASAVGPGEHPGRQLYRPPPHDEDAEMQDQEEGQPVDQPEEEQPEQTQEPQTYQVARAVEAQDDVSPAAEFLMGIMSEFRKLEGKLASLLKEQADLKDENEELRSRPPVPDPNTLQELDTLTGKYNKVKKLYFQKETQLEELQKENEGLRADADELAKEAENLKTDNLELSRDLDILDQERSTLAEKLQEALDERDTLLRQRQTLEQERDTLIQDKDELLNDRDNVEKEKEDAIQDRQDAIIERDDARQDRENLQNRIKDLEDEVAKLQAQNTTAANGAHGKRVSALAHDSAGSDYPQEILKLKYNKVKKLYYEQLKTISHLEDRLRMAEGQGRGEPASYSRPTNGASSKKATPARVDLDEDYYDRDDAAEPF
ncbi:hypothetical protein DRE_00713 [Drechslerella stenobrocha 248]|uniref:Uncharacterized protein n=1 Tax=Drechslerella stenobrocha 248 TaxID=1043628 RepID=W7HQ82_9PEZI|nr:hypothetical protein DRE_00713 [Drechslerella stenobrocha 248]